MSKNFFLSKTLELRKIGSNYCLYRQSDRILWEVNITKFSEFWEVLEQYEDILADKTLYDENLTYVLEQLIENDIIQQKDNISKFELLNYDNSNTASYSYHLSSARIKWTNYSDKQSVKKDDLDEMDGYVDEEQIPSNYKKYNNSEPKYYLEEYIKIPNQQSNTIFGKNLIKSFDSPNIEHINLIINNTFKQTNDVNMYATGKHIRKCVPSGGARHPIELYLFIADIKGIEAGLYHYNVKKHRLDKIDIDNSKLATLEVVLNIIPRGRSKKLVASFIHTCIFSRSMFRYREPRSYRVMHFDLGHIHANEVVLSNILNLDFCETYSIPENIVENIICIDGFDESVMSAFNIYGV